jgi:hypothetical protein
MKVRNYMGMDSYTCMDRGGEYQIGYLQNLQVISLWCVCVCVCVYICVCVCVCVCNNNA